ncbi:hypothetical protein Rruber_02716 [Rhodococcus ruber]|uniref:Uncharacterized protein n=1 Tax=Rhodococcus rhodochrous KG-21 TaxID=1441923 RepID=A0A0M9WP98_RHORH|nr:ImmA/IrrE family metallo-endopeptidase [Rhodococcus rhodochrous]KOS56460.1 hypothetical protein Z051_09640 [Rhodococcus rhodochrous KG-21]
MGRKRKGRRWHPWRHIGKHHPHIRVTCRDVLPDGLKGAWTGDTVYLDPSLGQASRRWVLTHEIHHIERGPVPDDPYLSAIEERIVDILSARKLIPLPQLVDALVWTQDHHELAEELWVDVDAIAVRLDNLTPAERAHIHRELARRQPWNN